MRERLARLLDEIASSSVIVVGDVMLDEYIIGDSKRISPEAPEPIIMEHEHRYVPGGAANVTVNITTLGAKAHLFGIVGNDSEGKIFRKILLDSGVNDSGILSIKGHPTTRKTRMIARGNQVLRVDRETTKDIESSIEDQIVESILHLQERVVIVSDYAKGTVTRSMIKRLIDSGKCVIVDPKSSDLSKYSNAYLVTPNLSELSGATGVEKLSPVEVEEPARKLMNDFNISNILVTFGPDGMALIEKNEPLIHIHARTMEVYDVTGAGDTVIASIGSAIAGGATLADACYVANFAAGIVVGKHQTATTTPKEIMAYAFGPLASDKIVNTITLLERIEELKKSGKKIVFTNGCFDLLHVGHMTYLNEARGLGDILVVGLNTDRSVRVLKGENRPIIPEQERSHLIAALECVDYVIMFDDDTPLDLIKKIQPDFLVKGSDYLKEEVVGFDFVESYGGKVSLLPLIDNISTSNIINKIKEKF